MAGLSLIELMVSITLGLMILSGVAIVFTNTSAARNEVERTSRQIENGRYALDRLAEDLRLAGFFSEYHRPFVSGEAGFPATVAATLPCATTAANLAAGLPIAVQAYDGGATVPADLSGCIAANDYQPNTDIVVVRRASTAAICPSTKACPVAVAPTCANKTVPCALASVNLSAIPNSNQMFLQAIPPSTVPPDPPKLDIGSNAATFSLKQPGNGTATPDAPLRKYVVRIYFVSRCNVPSSGTTCTGTDDGGTPIPTLKMLELGVDPTTGGGPQFNKLAIAEGIEQLQVDFGIDDTPSTANPITSLIGDGVADRIEAPSATGIFSTGASFATRDWSNVVSAQIYVVARNTERSPAYSDDKTYDLGIKGYTTAAGDQYRRHAYTSMVRLNNASMRRE